MCKCYWARGSGRWLSTPLWMMSRVMKVIIYIMPPIPPMPPMPPGMPPAPPSAFSGISVMTHSAVHRREATPAASVRAVLTTLAGSMIPVAIMSTMASLAASKPTFKLSFSTTLLTMTLASSPAFVAICMRGCLSACLIISIPFFWSSLAGVRVFRTGRQRSRATPPPGTMPSSTAALVAFKASVTLSFFSFTSTSEEPPILRTATPLASLAILSWIFSFSYSEFVSSICSLNWSTRLETSAGLPPSFNIMVSSLVMVTSPTLPKSCNCTSSNLRVSPSVPKTMPPVEMAMSCRVFFLLSPKPGAFTAATWSPIFNLLMTRVLSASPSMSSAMMMRGLLCWLASSRAGMMAWMLEIFFSEKRTRESWYSTLAPLVLLIKYGEMYPLSNFMPSMMSISSYRVFPSLTVMTPSLPTLAIASAIKLPTAVSPLAEIVATCAISSGVVTGLARLLRLSHTASTATIKPRLISTGLEPWVTLSKPLHAIALAKTVAVVVPSPASSLVLLATSWTSLAPMFSNLSFNSTALATVTPSLVIFGPPQEDSITTFLPLGPIVTATASAKTFTPLNISARTSPPNLTSLAKPLLEREARCVGALMVWRKAMGTRAARARLYILKFSLVTVGTAESLVEVNQAIKA